MYLYNESGGPALDWGLEQRLKRLDPRLKITFSSYSIDPQTGWPILDEDGKPIPEPAQHLWCKDRDGSWVHCDMYLMRDGGFQHINCYYLELNSKLAVSMKPEQIYRLMQERNNLEREIAKRKHKEKRMDRAKANHRRIGDLVFHGKSGQRQAKPVSYPGQTNRSTPGMVLKDAKEDGWELE